MLLQILFFLIDTLASFFAGLMLLRFLMQLRRLSFAHPLGQFVVKLTNWAVLPLRRIVPGVGGYDWASLLPAWVLLAGVQGLQLGLVLGGDVLRWLPAAALFGVLELIHLTVVVFIALVLVQAILSWVNPYAPLARPVAELTEPILAPLRRIVPTISGIDLSPLVALLAGQVVLMLLSGVRASLLPALL